MTVRIDPTGRLIEQKVCPDEIVRDLRSVGYGMVTYHESEKDKQGRSSMYWVMSCTFSHMVTGEHLSLENEKIYRLDVTSKGVVVTCYGLDAVDSELKMYYSLVDDLPEWVQKKLAVLYLLDPDKSNSNVEKVGRRINKSVFWIYPE